MTRQELDKLKERKLQFDMLELPGQPRMMHMGTSYLVNDLMNAVSKLWKELEGEQRLVDEGK